MIVVDANLLIYSYDVNAAEHKKSAAWLESSFSGVEIVGLPWPCICAFVRVVTNRRLPGTPVGLDVALGTIEEWLHSPNVQTLIPTERHWSVFRRMLVEGQVTGPQVTDAEIAALTVEYGGVLHTTDRDFVRFPGLRWVNPLG